MNFLLVIKVCFDFKDGILEKELDVKDLGIFSLINEKISGNNGKENEKYRIVIGEKIWWLLLKGKSGVKFLKMLLVVIDMIFELSLFFRFLVKEKDSRKVKKIENGIFMMKWLSLVFGCCYV